MDGVLRHAVAVGGRGGLREGALAVLLRDALAELVQRTVARLLATPGSREAARTAAGHRWQRRYRAGERVLLDPESALEVMKEWSP